MRTKSVNGKVVIVTGLRTIPRSCSVCKYYDCLGNRNKRQNDGICTARGYNYSTRHINVSKERLQTCPLVLVEKEGVL